MCSGAWRNLIFLNRNICNNHVYSNRACRPGICKHNVCNNPACSLNTWNNRICNPNIWAVVAVSPMAVGVAMVETTDHNRKS